MTANEWLLRTNDELPMTICGFLVTTPQVQLQMLTATVKLFLKRPAETQKMVQDVLTLATQDSDNPDLRDRGYIYWRLLSTDPEAAKQVGLSCTRASPIGPHLAPSDPTWPHRTPPDAMRPHLTPMGPLRSATRGPDDTWPR